MNSEKGFANISAECTYIEDFISRTRGLAEVSSRNGKKETLCCNISICFLVNDHQNFHEKEFSE